MTYRVSTELGLFLFQQFQTFVHGGLQNGFRTGSEGELFRPNIFQQLGSHLKHVMIHSNQSKKLNCAKHGQQERAEIWFKTCEKTAQKLT